MRSSLTHFTDDKLRGREVKQLAQGPPLRKLSCWDWNPIENRVLWGSARGQVPSIHIHSLDKHLSTYYRWGPGRQGKFEPSPCAPVAYSLVGKTEALIDTHIQWDKCYRGKSTVLWACQTQLSEIKEGFSKEDRGSELNSEGGVQLAYKAGVCKGRGI